MASRDKEWLEKQILELIKREVKVQVGEAVSRELECLVQEQAYLATEAMLFDEVWPLVHRVVELLKLYDGKP